MIPRSSKWLFSLLVLSALARPTVAAAAEGGEAAAQPAPVPAVAPAADASAEREAESTKARPPNLEEKIAPVSGHLFVKETRFEVTPLLGVSLSDAFFQKYLGGLKLTFHPGETFAIGAHFGYALNTPGGAVTVCKPQGGVSQCGAPSLDDLQDVPGRVSMISGLDLAWAPIYGKLNFFAEKVLHFDLSLHVGGDAIQYQVPGGGNAITFGGHLGLGQRYTLGRSTTLSLELRNYMYNAKIVQLGDSNTKFENQLMLELGLSFFLGDGPQS